MCYGIGYQLYPNRPNPDSLTADMRLKYFDAIYEAGRQAILQNQTEYGEIITRPADRRENYVKRCVGLPGQTLQIKDRIVYLDGKANKEPENVQYTYHVKLKQAIPEEMMENLGISMEDLTSLNTSGYMPLTNRAVKVLKAHPDIVESITLNTEANDLEIYPLNGNKHWIISPSTSVRLRCMRPMTCRFAMARSSSMAKRLSRTPLRWTIIGCKATIVTTLQTPVTGVLCPRIILWVSLSSSGGRAIQIVVVSMVSVGAGWDESLITSSDARSA